LVLIDWLLLLEAVAAGFGHSKSVWQHVLNVDVEEEVAWDHEDGEDPGGCIGDPEVLIVWLEGMGDLHGEWELGEEEEELDPVVGDAVEGWEEDGDHGDTSWEEHQDWHDEGGESWVGEEVLDDKVEADEVEEVYPYA